MINYFKGGIKDIKAEFPIEFDYLKFLITNNPQQKEIKRIWTLEYKSTTYDEAKVKLPYITPHGTFNDVRKDANLKKFSNILYFDIDKKDITCTASEYKNLILKNYSDKIYMLGKSVGGNGLFFYVKVKGKLTVNNFMNVWNYFADVVFKDLNIDRKATSISRPQFLPFDSDLYINDASVYEIPNNILDSNCLNKIESKVGCHSVYKYKKESMYIPTDTLFIDYKILLQTLLTETKIEFVNDEPYVIKEVDFVKVPILRIIKTGSRNSMFKIMVHALVYLNPTVTPHQLNSYINFWNVHMTDVPLSKKEMMQTVRIEFEKLHAGSKNIVRIKKKKFHTNPLYENRKQTANKLIGVSKVENSKKIIIDAIEILESQDKKITQKNVYELTESILSLSTVKRHWNAIIPKILAKEVILNNVIEMKKKVEKQTANTYKNENEMTSTKAPVLDIYITGKCLKQK